MIKFPFNESTALLLTALGFTLTQHEATWEDVGDAENGPKLAGGPAYDEWSNGITSVYVVDGMVEEVEACPPEWPELPELPPA